MRTYGLWLGCALLALPGLGRAMGLDNPPVPLIVPALGMGEAVVADGNFFNAAAYNPAVLSNAPNFCEIRLGFNVSNDVFGIANYLTNNNNLNNLQNSFSNAGNYIQDITQGLSSGGGGAINVTQVNQGISGVQSLVSNLQAASANLTGKTIALGAGLNIAMKFDDHVGFQVYSNAHAAVQINPQALIKELQSMAALPLLANSGSAVTTEAQAFYNTIKPLLASAFASQAVTLGQAVTTLVNTYSSGPSAAVQTFANTVSGIASSIDQNDAQQALLNDVIGVTSLVYIDTVAMVTYSFAPLEEETPLTVGVNLKLVNRRIGYLNSVFLSQQDLTNFSNVTNDVKNDIDQSTFRWGVDLGLLYEFKEEKLAVGISALDLLHSTATINAPVGDPLYGIVTDPAPTVVTAGVSWHPIHALSLNADMDDIFSNTSTYEGLAYTAHLKLGAAYNVLGFLQVRGGFSNNNLSAGLGIPFLGIDYAYAVDDLTQDYTHYLQFKVTI